MNGFYSLLHGQIIASILKLYFRLSKTIYGLTLHLRLLQYKLINDEFPIAIMFLSMVTVVRTQKSKISNCCDNACNYQLIPFKFEYGENELPFLHLIS